MIIRPKHKISYTKSIIRYISKRHDLKSFSDGCELRAVDFDLASRHVSRLLGVERVGDTSHHEHVQLLTTSSVLLLFLRALSGTLPLHAAAATVWRRQRRTRTGRTDAGRVYWRGRHGTYAVHASDTSRSSSTTDTEPNDVSWQRRRTGSRSWQTTSK